MIWFNLDGNLIVGYQRSPGASEVPAGSVATDEAGIALYQTLREQSRNDGREDGVIWNATTQLPELPPDNRIVLNLTVNAPRVALNGSLTFTFTLPDFPNFSGTVYRKFYGKWLELDFTNGVCPKDLVMRENGQFRISSTPEYRILTPVEYLVYE